ncbi:hypothetical protein L2E82_04869 [Cichorium intybus]|uniref:Uncharacterized protein n=1 Tax=Cichorium intybus TaxID=13427 RepID=A0ACB9H5R5_CICIN|nr:hypothetical protein L2E82_04869 [Cichorium intybus]
MEEQLADDILEQILKRLDVRDLIRCKSVCKSWKIFISTSRFIKAHLNHSYSTHCNSNDVDTRIVMQRSHFRYQSRQFEFDKTFFNHSNFHLLGSSNGLVCISYFGTEIVVANPSTRDVKRIKEPQIRNTASLCGGFGYDPSMDDYKVILGFKKVDGQTCFQVLTLKSNIWKVIGDVNYSVVSRIGILCNGALHWVMKDASSQDNKNMIISFRLSEEEFTEIPQPDDVGYEYGVARHPTMRLGIMEECLCVFNYEELTDNLWMMKNYNVRQSWGMVGKDCEKKSFVHCLKELKHYIPHKRSFCHDMWFSSTREFIGAPIFVKSLVSPHVNGKPKRMRQASNSKKSRKDQVAKLEAFQAIRITLLVLKNPCLKDNF